MKQEETKGEGARGGRALVERRERERERECRSVTRTLDGDECTRRERGGSRRRTVSCIERKNERAREEIAGSGEGGLTRTAIESKQSDDRPSRVSPPAAPGNTFHACTA